MGDYGDAFSAAVAGELRAERGRKRVTIETLVNRTGLAKSTVLNYLNGKREIPMASFVELCEVLDVPPTVIFGRAEKSTEKH